MGFGFFSSGNDAGVEAQSRDRSIEVDGHVLPVRVVEMDRARRITLRILPGGDGLKVTMPPHVSEHELDAFLERNRNWVASRRSRLPDAICLTEGAIVPFLGVDHRVVSTGDLRGLVGATSGDKGPVLTVPGDASVLPGRLIRFFKSEARRHLDIAVQRHAVALDVRPRMIRITDTASRWGSCSSSRTLSFSWRIVMAPPEVLDYLAAHEVAHLREMNHSNRFWSLVRKTCPDMDRHKAWLRANGPRLHAVRAP